MPKLTRKTSHVDARKPFGVYDGETPTPGNYPGVIKSVALRTFSTGTQAFNVLVELEAPADSPHSKYNGFPAWTQIFLGEHEASIARENAFYQAVSGKSDVDVVFDDKSEKKEPPITKIGGVKPETATAAEAFSVEQLIGFFGDEYEEGDLDGLSKDDLIQQLQDDELLTAF